MLLTKCRNKTDKVPLLVDRQPQQVRITAMVLVFGHIFALGKDGLIRHGHWNVTFWAPVQSTPLSIILVSLSASVYLI